MTSTRAGSLPGAFRGAHFGQLSFLSSLLLHFLCKLFSVLSHSAGQISQCSNSYSDGPGCTVNSNKGSCFAKKWTDNIYFAVPIYPSIEKIFSLKGVFNLNHCHFPCPTNALPQPSSSWNASIDQSVSKSLLSSYLLLILNRILPGSLR